MQAILDFIPDGSAFQRGFNCFIQDSLVLDTINHQAIGHIIINGHWKGIGLLEDHSDFLTQFDRIGPWSVDIVTVVEDGPCGGDLMIKVPHAVNGF